ncbi:MAG: hypothetical protein ACFFE7_13690 [Candidatus Thorarchaeota archaeon]
MGKDLLSAVFLCVTLVVASHPLLEDATVSTTNTEIMATEVDTTVRGLLVVEPDML